MKPLKPHSQCDRILGWLAAGRTLTPLQALNRFGCLALSQRITQLKGRGHRIQSELVKVRGGKRVARYALERH